MSIMSKFNLLSLISENNISKEWGLVSASLSDNSDEKSTMDCPFVSINQMPDISSSNIGCGFDLFIIRLFYSPITDDKDIEILFDNISSIFRFTNDSYHEIIYKNVKYCDYFEYQDGSENKKGIQKTGNKLYYKQFSVNSPKSNRRS
jgi:hypothetical protein